MASIKSLTLENPADVSAIESIIFNSGTSRFKYSDVIPEESSDIAAEKSKAKNYISI